MILGYVIKAGSLTQMLLCLVFCNFTAWDLRESTVSQGESNIKNQDFSVRSNMILKLQANPTRVMFHCWLVS